MSRYMPPALIPVFRVVMGTEWENLDTDAMRAGARDLQTLADQLKNDVAPEISLAVRNVQQGIEGQASPAFAANMAPYTERDPRYLYAAVDQYQSLAKFLDEGAVQVEYVHIMVFLQLALLLIQILWAYANAAWTLGGSMVWLATQFAITRVLVTNWLGQLILHILAAEVVSVALMVALDRIAQFIQKEILHTR